MRNGIHACALALAMLCGADAAADTPSAEEDIAAATALMDGWGGRGEALAMARQRLERVLQASPKSDAALRQLARVQLSEGYQSGDLYEPAAVDAAVATAARAVAAAPGNPDNYLVHADMLVRAKRIDDAEAALAQARASGARGAFLALVAGEVARWRGQAGDAIRHFEAVLAAAPSIRVAARARGRLIQAANAAGDLDAAERHHRAAIDAEPGDAWTRGNYASFLLCRRDDDVAALRTVRAARALADYPIAMKLEAAAQYRRWSRAVAAGDAAGATAILREAGLDDGGQPAALLYDVCGRSPGVLPTLEAMRSTGVGERIPGMLAVMLAADSDSGSVPGIFSIVVQASGAPDRNVYLNSEPDYRDQRNLSIDLTPRAQALLRAQGGDPLLMYRGLRIEVAGFARKVKIGFQDAEGQFTGKYYYQTHVTVDDPAQITVVEAKRAR